MSKITEFRISFDGEALRNHLMDVKDLAPSILALAQLFEEANRLLNDNKVNISLNIKAQDAGSFEVLLALSQSVYDQITNFLSGDFVTSVLNLKELIIGGVGLFFLIKAAKGKQPDKITDLKNGNVRLEIGNEVFEIPIDLLRLYQSLLIRKAAEEVLKPLYKVGIERILFKEKKETIQEIDKKDLPCFEVPALEEKIVETEGEAAFSIVSLAFKEDNKWRLSQDGKSTINVIIRDREFLERVEKNLVSFAKNDILKCLIRTKQWATEEGLKTEYEVIKVIDHISSARQLFLFKELE